MFPLVLAARPVVAWRQRRAKRLGAGRILVSWSRSNLDKIIRLCCTIEAPRARAGEALDVITAQLAGIIASIGMTVGVVGVVAGEEPVLTAFAPMRDLIAPRIRDALGGGTAHLRRHLWLTLPGGTYLASVVNPYLPFEGSAEEVAGLLRAGLVAQAFSGRMKVGPAGARFELDAYARRPDLRKLLSLVRNDPAEVVDRLEAR